MKQALSAPVRFWHLLVVSVIVAALTSTVMASAAPAAPSFVTQGTIRMAFASGTDANMVTVPSGYTNVSVLSTSITVPAGMKAEIAVMGEVDMEGGALTGNQYCFGQYRLGDINSGKQFKPGNYILEGFNPPANNLSVPINGYLGGVGAGKHTINMVMQAGYANCYALDRSMIVIANIHP